MECPYCGAELRYEDYYGKWQGGICKKMGDIYECQNKHGFNTKLEAEQYAKENNIEYDDWQEILCDSMAFNGFFYTDSLGNFHEGYPC